MQISIYRKYKENNQKFFFNGNISADTTPNIGDTIVYDRQEHIVTDKKWEVDAQGRYTNSLNCIIYIEPI